MKDRKVRQLLKKLGQPEELQDESEEQRRLRLSQLGENDNTQMLDIGDQLQVSKFLQQRRTEWLKYSLDKSMQRIIAQKLLQEVEVIFPGLNLVPQGSQYVEQRVPTSCLIEQDRIVTAGWSGLISYWDKKLNLIGQFQAHDERVLKISGQDNFIVSASTDKTAKVWKEQEMIFEAKHDDRVNMGICHFANNTVFTISHDQTIKVWDIEYNQLLYTQRGHPDAIFCMDLHPDGSLLATSDISGNCALWDIRSG